MANIRGYMGVSLDHYIAGPGGNLDWLTRYDTADFGEHAYPNFIRQIRTVVMGRATYDWLIEFGGTWPYSDKRAIIVTSRPLTDPPVPLTVWAEGVTALIAHLRALDDGDVWIVGGGQLQQALIAQDALDRLELFVVPEIVGEGIPLFPPNGHRRSVRFVETNNLDRGVVRMVYDFRRADG
jgi:dihydrofolate reductase